MAQVEVEVVNDNPGSTQSLVAQIQHSLGLCHGHKQLKGEMASETTKSKLEEIELEVKDALETHTNRDDNIAGPDNARSDDEDEAWASESEASESEQYLQAGVGPSKRRVKAHSVRRQPSSSSRHRGRRRLSSQRPNPPFATDFQSQSTVPGSSPEASSTSPTPGISPEEEESRGRSYPTHAHFASEPHPYSIMASNGSLFAPGSPRTWTGRHRHRRPGTADNSIVRPGTGDSSLRNARVSHIRMLHSSPPTRKASPSRSVRFMDEKGDDSEVKDKVSFDIGRRSPSETRRT